MDSTDIVKGVGFNAEVTKASKSVEGIQKRCDISVRMGAYVVAVGRVAKAVQLRGLVK